MACAIIQKLSDSTTEFGGIAQLGERLNGIQEVSGSIPLISTTKASKSSDFEAFCLFPLHISSFPPCSETTIHPATFLSEFCRKYILAKLQGGLLSLCTLSTTILIHMTPYVNSILSSFEHFGYGFIRSNIHFAKASLFSIFLNPHITYIS